ncbi:MAG: glycine--tRNA ligase [Patescibacteria group bacterium]|jgi:glycyl-tRNA synthetase|nr:glycine--tRNA ligase [Patescibacteria group bacterium]
MAKKIIDNQLMDKIISLTKQRGFIYPSSEIYGGFANTWDYGPLGVELKNNIKRKWWRRFVHGRCDIVGIDAALIMNPKVWQASGHLKNFTDPLVDCKKCKKRFRADHLLEVKGIKPDLGTMKEAPQELKECPECGGELTPVRKFNLMFKTFVGPVEDDTAVAYLRPETAQAMFVDFKNVIDSTRTGFPFGIAQIGKAFRNEITPGNFTFRTREFEQMEIEYFIKEQDWEKYFEHWLNEMKAWIDSLGISQQSVVYREIGKDELAHYSKRTVDIDFMFPFGQDELYGLAYRTDYDLKSHAELSGQDLSYTDPKTNEKFIPHVIEPTWGVDRTLLAVLVSAFTEEAAPTADGKTETRVVLKLPKDLAPYQAAVLPLSKKEELTNLSKELADDLRKYFSITYDETQSIGRRYRRQDEIGTPYCITIDFDTLNDKSVTVRDRDSMSQERVKVDQLAAYLLGKLNG